MSRNQDVTFAAIDFGPGREVQILGPCGSFGMMLPEESGGDMFSWSTAWGEATARGKAVQLNRRTVVRESCARSIACWLIIYSLEHSPSVAGLASTTVSGLCGTYEEVPVDLSAVVVYMG
jgi:hypothetical protein